MTEFDERAALAWLDTLERIADRAGHELRNALNGVAVNLEVSRSRSRRAGAEMSAVAPFVAAAAQQFEVATGLAENLLALTRAPRNPVDVGRTAHEIGAVLGPVARQAGGDLSILVESDATGVTQDARLVRAVIGDVMLGGVARPDAVRYTVNGDEHGVHIRCEGGGSPGLSGTMQALAASAGIGTAHHGEVMALTFPRRARPDEATR